MFVWNDASSEEYPSVRVFAQRMKHAVMSTHDAILEVRVKQAQSANCKRRVAPFVAGDLVYVSTKNMSLPKGQARKNNLFELDLPPWLKQCGVHPVFHLSLLRAHIPNDDRLFPGRLETQVADFGEVEPEWSVKRILSHQGSGTNAIFEVKWTSGNITWMAYIEVSHLAAMNEYLALIEVEKIDDLPRGTRQPPDDDPQVYNGLCQVCVPSLHPAHPCRPPLFIAEPMDDLRHSHNILQHGDDFIFIDLDRSGQFVVPRWHLHLCLEYSKQIHTTIFRNRMEPAPVRYFLVTHTYNNEHSVASNFSLFDEDGRWLTNPRPEPSPQTFFGSHPPIPPCNAMEACSTELANAIADSELAQRHHISRNVEERINRRGVGNNALQLGILGRVGRGDRRGARRRDLERDDRR